MNIDKIRSTHESMPKGPWRWKELSIVRLDVLKRADGTTIYRDEEVVSVEMSDSGKVDVVEAWRADGAKEYLAESWENIETLIKACDQLQSEVDEMFSGSEIKAGLSLALHALEGGDLPTAMREIRNLFDLIGEVPA